MATRDEIRDEQIEEVEAELEEENQDETEPEPVLGVEEASDPLEEARKEAEAYKDRWLRLAAEFENYKKRTSREFDALVQSASESVIRDLLPVLDAVGRALDHGTEGNTDSEAYQAGVKMIMEQFPKALFDRGLSEIEAVGQAFDPNYHEALMQVESEEYGEGVVTNVVERGYALGDRVLRHAKVVVSRGNPASDERSVEEK
ncbi:MAG: nucleotide exchange factor GrpE [bacterium]|nr:nucleotide exchange factor GrpE [bacterium]